ncbi:MAG: hypothetical protein AAGC55_14745 [Myxococcota bacterium]
MSRPERLGTGDGHAAETASCPHHERVDGVCQACGHCLHEIILNGECYFCASRDIDGASVSPRSVDTVIPASSLVRRRPDSGDNS